MTKTYLEYSALGNACAAFIYTAGAVFMPAFWISVVLSLVFALGLYCAAQAKEREG